MYYVDRIPVGFSIAALRTWPPIRSLRVWLRYRINLRQVAGLDERTLRDIGADRGTMLYHAWRNACED